jgi:exo-beta-1,3-glucanase (GH17 family)/cellulose synthase/poly-beta-1,6-N-acetylglucosamine synthase-like glycosyltransferase
MTRTTQRLLNIVIAVSVATITFSVWALLNLPVSEPVWPKKIPGYSFSPMRLGQSGITGILPSVEEIEADLKLLKGTAYAIRTYSVEGTLAGIPALARKHGLNVTLGAWIGQDRDRNEREITKVIHLARSNGNVVRVIIGNEAVLRADIPLSEMTGHLDKVRKALRVPVSTAEPWHVWIRYPELAEHVDFIAVHMLPYWEGVDVDLAVEYIVNSITMLKQAFPGKQLVIAEVGWPSNGRTRRSAVASVANEATFLRRFIERAQKENYTFYIMEAFDQPWKRNTEGAVGAYWGVYNVERQPKFSFREPIVGIPHWHILAATSILVAVITLAFLLMDSTTLRGFGRTFLAILAYTAAAVAVWVVHDYTNQYLTVKSVVVGILLIIGMFGIIMVLLAEAHEWVEVLWVTGRRRSFNPVVVNDEDLPMVSVHVAAYNEPPDMVIETLDALSAMDYPNYEVLVIDNNTKDESVWHPVAVHCKKLGSRFRFFHVDPLSGFKSGALNFTLKHTHPDAVIVAVIDSDYIVDRTWLRDLAPQFLKPEIAIVQAPQDYRDSDTSAFKSMAYAEYCGFFFIGMITRNERNAIIQHGTMTMVRRSVLENVGGWAEWCITEDAELGLRIFEKGYEAIYIAKSYGKGLMPDTFIDYKKQRFRWAYGAVQIMKRHVGTLLGFAPNRLTAGQRYHFIAGWMPWLADGLNLLFNLAAIIWSTAMILAPKWVDPPMIAFSLFPLAFFVFKEAKIFSLYNAQAGATILQTLSAALAGSSLSHTIARAVLQGIVSSRLPFFRTPKLAESEALRNALASAREETFLMAVLWLAAGALAVVHGFDTPDMLLWIIVLLAQSIPYATTLFVSLISAFPSLRFGSIASSNLIRARI